MSKFKIQPAAPKEEPPEIDDRWTRPLQPGDVVQIDPDKSSTFAGCLVTVLKVEEEGRSIKIMLSLPNPIAEQSQRIYLQIPRNDVGYVGPGVWHIDQATLDQDMEIQRKSQEEAKEVVANFERKFAESVSLPPEKRN